MNLKIDDLIEKVKRAYEVVGRVPSRGVGDKRDLSYASAWTAMEKSYELFNAHGGAATAQGEFAFLDELTEDWKEGFRAGFEWKNGLPRWEEFSKGFDAGVRVADAIFTWSNAPNFQNCVGLMETSKLYEEVELLRREVKRLSGLITPPTPSPKG